MKREWQKPALEVLNVNRTMGGTVYNQFDSDFQDQTDIPTDSDGNPLIGES